MLIELLENDVLQLSLFLRAVIYAAFFLGVGVEILHASDRLSVFSRGLGYLALIAGIVNAIMALEWLFLFFFTGATLG